MKRTVLFSNVRRLQFNLLHQACKQYSIKRMNSELLKKREKPKNSNNDSFELGICPILGIHKAVNSGLDWTRRAMGSLLLKKASTSLIVEKYSYCQVVQVVGTALSL